MDGEPMPWLSGRRRCVGLVRGTGNKSIQVERFTSLFGPQSEVRQALEPGADAWFFGIVQATSFVGHG
jgi:hypothetical protein